MRRAPLVPALLVLGAAVAPASADVFVFKDGREVDGILAGRTEKKEIVILMPTGKSRYFESSVKEIRPSKDPAADFARYFAGLGKKDADGAAALGAWAAERGLPDRAKEAFLRALAIDPGQPKAHEGLGHVKVGDEWIPAAEAGRLREALKLREDAIAAYRTMLGTEPQVLISRHWKYVDFLGDGKTKDRLKDLEAAYDEALRVFGSDPWPGRGLAIALTGTEQYHRWLDAEVKGFSGVNKSYMDSFKASTGMKYTDPPALGRSDLPDKGAMQAAFVHSSGHILLNAWKGVNRTQPFWIEEGFGAWMEDTVLKSNTSFCWDVGKATGYGSLSRQTKDWEGEDIDWKDRVKKAAAANEFLPLDQLDSLPRGEYKRREVGQSFALVAFLLKDRGPERFRDYVARVKSGEKSPAAFQKAYDATFEQIEADWKRWVQSTW
jgi:hypothetical protein